MIVAAAVCPHPPLLLRELTGAQDPVAGLRAECLSAVAAVTRDDPDVVLVVGGDGVSRSWDPSLAPEVRRFGTTGAADGPGLPLSLGVGMRLLDEAGWAGAVELTAVAWDAPPEEVAELAERIAGRAERVALLVLGDGSARRGEKAPGYLDDRAFDFDASVARALAEGNAAALEAMDVSLADELMVLGRAAFGVLGSVVRRQGDAPNAELAHQDDPFGVMYLVAVWQLSGESAGQTRP